MIGIEQTSAGYAKIVGAASRHQHRLPSAKLLYESPIIAARVTQTAFERTAGIDSSAAILITGAGAIGTSSPYVRCMTGWDVRHALQPYDAHRSSNAAAMSGSSVLPAPPVCLASARIAAPRRIADVGVFVRSRVRCRRAVSAHDAQSDAMPTSG